MDDRKHILLSITPLRLLGIAALIGALYFAGVVLLSSYLSSSFKGFFGSLPQNRSMLIIVAIVLFLLSFIFTTLARRIGEHSNEKWKRVWLIEGTISIAIVFLLVIVSRQ